MAHERIDAPGGNDIKMTRTEFPKAVKRQAWKRCKSLCEECGCKLFPGRYIYDHNVPDHLGGPATLENCVVRCKNCDRTKTAKDQGQIAKMKRQRDRDIGIKRRKGRPMAGNRGGKWKMTFRHGPVLR